MSLQALLREYFAEEAVKIHCDRKNCDGDSARSKHKILSFPKVLVLHLKRFSHDASKVLWEKNEDKVAIDPVIDLGTTDLVWYPSRCSSLTRQKKRFVPNRRR